MLNKNITISLNLERYEVPNATIIMITSNDVITESDPYVADIEWDL